MSKIKRLKDYECEDTTTTSVPGAGDDSSTVVVKKKKKLAKVLKRKPFWFLKRKTSSDKA
jgi:hypothetical protein